MILELWTNVFWNLQCLWISYRTLDDSVNAAWKETACPKVRLALLISSCIGADLGYSMWVGGQWCLAKLELQ